MPTAKELEDFASGGGPNPFDKYRTATAGAAPIAPTGGGLSFSGATRQVEIPYPEGEFGAGFSSGMESAKSFAFGALPAAVGRATGLRGVEEFGLRSLEGHEAKSAEAAARSRITSVEQIENLKDLIDYGQFTMGSTSPFIIETAASALLGALGGATIGAQPGAVGGAVAGVSSSFTRKAALKTAIKAFVQGTATGVQRDAARKAIIGTSARMAATAGTYGLIAFPDQYRETIEANQPNVGLAAAAAVPYALAEVGSELFALGRVKKAAERAKRVASNADRLKAVAAGAASGFVQASLVEGATEGFQELTLLTTHDLLDPDFEMTDAEAMSRLKEAAAAGAVVGGVLGGVGGGVGGLARPTQAEQGPGQAQGQAPIPPIPPGLGQSGMQLPPWAAAPPSMSPADEAQLATTGTGVAQQPAPQLPAPPLQLPSGPETIDVEAREIAEPIIVGPTEEDQFTRPTEEDERAANDPQLLEYLNQYVDPTLLTGEERLHLGNDLDALRDYVVTNKTSRAVKKSIPIVIALDAFKEGQQTDVRTTPDIVGLKTNKRGDIVMTLNNLRNLDFPKLSHIAEALGVSPEGLSKQKLVNAIRKANRKRQFTINDLFRQENLNEEQAREIAEILSAVPETDKQGVEDALHLRRRSERQGETGQGQADVLDRGVEEVDGNVLQQPLQQRRPREAGERKPQRQQRQPPVLTPPREVTPPAPPQPSAGITPPARPAVASLPAVAPAAAPAVAAPAAAVQPTTRASRLQALAEMVNRATTPEEHAANPDVFLRAESWQEFLDDANAVMAGELDAPEAIFGKGFPTIEQIQEGIDDLSEPAAAAAAAPPPKPAAAAAKKAPAAAKKAPAKKAKPPSPSRRKRWEREDHPLVRFRNYIRGQGGILSTTLTPSEKTEWKEAGVAFNWRGPNGIAWDKALQLMDDDLRLAVFGTDDPSWNDLLDALTGSIDDRLATDIEEEAVRGNRVQAGKLDPGQAIQMPGGAWAYVVAKTARKVVLIIDGDVFEHSRDDTIEGIVRKPSQTDMDSAIAQYEESLKEAPAAAAPDEPAAPKSREQILEDYEENATLLGAEGAAHIRDEDLAKLPEEAPSAAPAQTVVESMAKAKRMAAARAAEDERIAASWGADREKIEFIKSLEAGVEFDPQKPLASIRALVKLRREHSRILGKRKRARPDDKRHSKKAAEEHAKAIEYAESILDMYFVAENRNRPLAVGDKVIFDINEHYPQEWGPFAVARIRRGATVDLENDSGNKFTYVPTETIVPSGWAKSGMRYVPPPVAPEAVVGEPPAAVPAPVKPPAVAPKPPPVVSATAMNEFAEARGRANTILARLTKTAKPSTAEQLGINNAINTAQRVVDAIAAGTIDPKTALDSIRAAEATAAQIAKKRPSAPSEQPSLFGIAAEGELQLGGIAEDQRVPAENVVTELLTDVMERSVLQKAIVDRAGLTEAQADEVITDMIARGAVYDRGSEVEKPRFMLQDDEGTETQGIPVEVAQIAVDGINKWPGAPPIHVVQTPDELPGEVLATGYDLDTIRGAFWNGDIWIVADNNGSPGEVQRTLLHEVVGHFGIEKMLGKRLNGVLNQVWMSYGQSNLTDIIDSYYPEGDFDPSLREHRFTVAREKLAHMANNGEKIHIVNRVTAMLKVWLRKAGFTLRMTDNDLLNMIRQSEQLLQRQPQNGHQMMTAADLNVTTAELAELRRLAPEDLLKAAAVGDNRGLAAEMIWWENAYVDRPIQSGPAAFALRGKAWDERSLQGIPLGPKKFLGSKMNQARPKALILLTLGQIVDVYKSTFPALNEHMDRYRAMFAERQKSMQADDRIKEELRGFIKRDKVNADKFIDVMYDSRLSEVDPRIAFVRDPKRSRAAEALRRKEHKRVKADFDALPDEAKELYTKINEAYNHKWLAMQDALFGRIDRAIVNKKAARELKTEIQLTFDRALTHGPYFPLSRFGDFLVVATKAGEERIVTAFESAVDQARALKHLGDLGYDAEPLYSGDYDRETHGVSSKFVADLFKTIDKDKFEIGQKDKLKDEINQMFLKTMPDLSYRKHAIHAKGTPGFSRDALRTFAHSTFHAANYISRLNHADVIFDQIEGINNEDRRGQERVLKSQLTAELQRRYSLAMDPRVSPIAQKMAMLGFAWNIGPSIASGLVNTTQTWLISFPTMAARYGIKDAAAALTKATGAYLRSPLSWETGFDLSANPEIGPAQQAALKWLQEHGYLDVTLAHDLAQAARHDFAKGDLAVKMQRVNKWVSYPFHIAEVYNRQATGLAAYNLAIDNGLDNQQAIEYAAEVIEGTHFEYAQFNRARFMAGDWPRVFLMFRQFSQNMTYFLVRAGYQVVADQDPQVKREAAKRLTGVLALNFMATGALGMPMVTVFSSALNMISDLFGDDDEPFDAESHFRQKMAEMFGQEGGEAISRGLPRIIPFLGIDDIDIASRVELNDLWYRGPDETLEGRDLAAAYLTIMAGPIASNVSNSIAGTNAMSDGHYIRGLEMMMPKAIKDAIRAFRYQTHGVQTFNRDQLIDDMTFAEKLGTGIGFTPSRVAETYAARRAVRLASKGIGDRRQQLINDWVRAKNDGDNERVRKLQLEIRQFSKKQPEFKITRSTLVRSRRARARTGKEIIKGRGAYAPGKPELRERGAFAGSQ